MKRAKIDLAALVFAALGVTALITLGPSTPVMSSIEARAEAADYLSAPPVAAQRDGEHWVVSDGRETATLDARTGELVEIDFGKR